MEENLASGWWRCDCLDSGITGQHFVIERGANVWAPGLPTSSGSSGLIYVSSGTLKRS